MFKTRLREMLNRRGDEFAESAIAFPMVILLVIAMFNLSLAGFASVNAANAANYGARSAASTSRVRQVQPTPPHRIHFPCPGRELPGHRLRWRVPWRHPARLRDVERAKLHGSDHGLLRQFVGRKTGRHGFRHLPAGGR